jgi:DNA polymerase III subunit gamma/tau
MSTSRSSRSVVASVHPTRQQLDELDALLQRMLELPVNQVEEAQALAPPPVEARPPAAPRLARAPNLRFPSPSPSSEPVQPRSRVQPQPAVEPATAPEPVEPAPAGLEPRVVPAPEPPDEEPAGNSLPVQPPHLFRNRSQPQEREAPEPETPEPEGLSETAEQGEDWVPLRSSWKPSPHTWPPLAESWHQAQQGGPELPVVRRDAPVTPEPQADPTPTAATTMEQATPSAAIPVAPPRPAPAPEQHVKEPGRDEPRPETIIYPRPTFPIPENNGVTTSRLPEIKAGDAEAAPGEDDKEYTAWLLRPLVWVNSAFNGIVGLGGPPGRWLTGSAGKALLAVVGVLCLLAAVGLLTADWLGWTW